MSITQNWRKHTWIPEGVYGMARRFIVSVYSSYNSSNNCCNFSRWTTSILWHIKSKLSRPEKDAEYLKLLENRRKYIVEQIYLKNNNLIRRYSLSHLSVRVGFTKEVQNSLGPGTGSIEVYQTEVKWQWKTWGVYNVFVAKNFKVLAEEVFSLHSTQ